MSELSSALSSTGGFSVGVSGVPREKRPRTDFPSACRASRTRLKRPAALRRGAVEERVILQLQPLHDALGQAAAAQNAVLRVVVPDPMSCQNIGSFALRLLTAVVRSS